MKINKIEEPFSVRLKKDTDNMKAAYENMIKSIAEVAKPFVECLSKALFILRTKN